MATKTRHRLPRTPERGAAVTRPRAQEAPRLLRAKYGRPTKPPATDGKMPDPRGADMRGAIRSGGAEAPASVRQTVDQLRVFARRSMPETDVPDKPPVIAPFGHAEAAKNTMRRTGPGCKIVCQMQAWPSGGGIS